MKSLFALIMALLMLLGRMGSGSVPAPQPGSSTPTPPPASGYPAMPVTVICPWDAGGGSDACLRAFSYALNRELGGNYCLVANLTGGSGRVGHQAIADAEPDGYTIGMITSELSAYKPLGEDLTWESYDLLCRVTTDPAAVIVNAGWAGANGITDLNSFIKYCQENPGEVWMGSSSTGGVWHLAGGALMEKTGIDIEMITYADGAAGAVRAAASGEVQGVTVSLAEARAFIESGHLVCLGYMSEERSAAFPDVPTCKEQGYDLVFGVWRGLAAPKGLSGEQLSVLRDACAQAISNEYLMDVMVSYGFDQQISYLDGEDFETFLKEDAARVLAAMQRLGMA